MITAILKNHRIAPRKVRLVADMVRGKAVQQAEVILSNAVKKAKNPIGALLASAIANAEHNHKMSKDQLYVKDIFVNQGIVLKRFMPVSRGMAHPIKKRTSHINIVLGVREAKVANSKKGTTKKSNSKNKI
jgi:large subunit ribosomal protein L22